MAYSSKWLQFRQAEQECFNSRHDFLQDKEALVNDLKQVLTRPDDRQTALQLLVQIYPDVAVLMPLLEQVLSSAIDSSNLTVIGLAREVLARYQAEP